MGGGSLGYCWGALTPYITSYLRKFDPTLQYSDTIIVFMLTPAAQAMAMPVSGMIEKKIGPRITALIGGVIFAAGVAFSAYATTIRQLLITYAFTFGVGMGIVYMNPITCGMKWLPDRKGVISGIVVAGFGLGGAFFNVLGAYICNPENKQPDPFFDEDVADRVPLMFMVLGAAYFVMITLSALLLRDPTEEELQLLHASESKSQDLEERTPIKPKPHPSLSKDVDLAGFLCDGRGYLLWAMMTATTMAGILVIGTYKTYGNQHGFTDRTLTIIGSITLVVNGAGRLFYGALADTIGFKMSMVACFSLQALMVLFFVPSTISPILYCLVVCGTIANYGANFPLYPTATAEIFGTKYVGQNYGVVFSGFAAAGILLKLGLSAGFLSYETLILLTSFGSGIGAIGAYSLTSPWWDKKEI
eukprot:jgi/Bigna1/89181/estExt_fgenesh1_pg.C_450022